MSGEFDSRKDSQSTKLKRRPQIFVKLSLRELCDSKLSGYISERLHVSGIRLPDCSKEAKTQKNDNDVTISRCEVIVIFFDAAMFLMASLVTGPSFMSILLLFLEL